MSIVHVGENVAFVLATKGNDGELMIKRNGFQIRNRCYIILVILLSKIKISEQNETNNNIFDNYFTTLNVNLQ